MSRSVSRFCLLVLALVVVGCTVEVRVPLEVSEEVVRAEATVAYVRDRVVTDESGKVYIRLVGEEDPIAKYAKGLKLGNKAMEAELCDALRNRGLRSKEVSALKKRGAVGESSDGRLAYTPSAKQKDRTLERDEIIEAENKDRETLLGIYATCFSDKAPKDEAYRKELSKTFAGAVRKQASPGEWVQDDAGRWARK